MKSAFVTGIGGDGIKRTFHVRVPKGFEDDSVQILHMDPT
jgi:hypothetical protein